MKQYFQLCGDRIIWNVKPEDYGHRDSFEFSGLGVDCIIGYGVQDHGEVFLSRYNAFPRLRIQPNETHGTFAVEYEDSRLPSLYIDGKRETEYAERFEIDGILHVFTKTASGICVQRDFIAASSQLAMCEICKITNHTGKKIRLSFDKGGRYATERGTKGMYLVEVLLTGEDQTLDSGETYTYCIDYTARINGQKLPVLNHQTEYAARKARIAELCSEAALDTGNDLIDTMYKFAKIRAGESIFDTDGGKLHSPGGKVFYAASWCNDQVEYAGPWFAVTGDPIAMEASLNAYRHYIPFMADTYDRIPSSVVAEGRSYWDGAGDRGDAAMYLYGASLFALTDGVQNMPDDIWNAIKWCAEYCKRKTLPEGVVFSDSDELEGRFPTDRRANLSTSCLAYGGYLFAAMLADAKKEHRLAHEYRSRAEALAVAIEAYFGAELHGYQTYRYSAGYDTLRAWICLPLCMGITNRLDDTIAAMFSEYLWTENGMLTCEKGPENTSDTIWDRSTLYGFKGAFINGMFDEKWDAFSEYCTNRLLSERVPYAVEAYPEGGKRQLSGESALFCRIITEGILSIRPESASSFSFVPRVPKGMQYVQLTNFKMCGKNVSVYIAKDQYRLMVGDEAFVGATNNQRVMIVPETAFS